jgi:CxxC motif-containing protein (DUF1111 family)
VSRLRALVLVCVACGDNGEALDRQGGDTTVDDRTRDAFSHPAANLSVDERARFQAGRSTFGFRWEVPKLGPLFNNVSCLGCHGGNGRGLSQIGGDIVSQALVRVSLTDGAPGDPGGPIPLPGYGTQLQDHATVGLPEVTVDLSWLDFHTMYGDGEPVVLREPRLDIRIANGTPFPANARFSYRIAPPVIGLGLLEAIPEAALQALEDVDDADGDGISGRINRVWDPVVQATVLGRFGWKANTSSLHVQTAGASVNDIGLTSYVFPDPTLNDLTDLQLDDMAFFTSTIAVPAAAPLDRDALHGRTLFRRFQCASCHVETQVTGDHAVAVVANQKIHPYTDLLLHDMGDLLTDARTDFAAEGTEWRTPALWGIGLTQTVLPAATFLHDGRARTLAEAILWHGGEAMAAREAFRTATSADRAALLAFLMTL